MKTLTIFHSIFFILALSQNVFGYSCILNSSLISECALKICNWNDPLYWINCGGGFPQEDDIAIVNASISKPYMLNYNGLRETYSLKSFEIGNGKESDINLQQITFTNLNMKTSLECLIKKQGEVQFDFGKDLGFSGKNLRNKLGGRISWVSGYLRSNITNEFGGAITLISSMLNLTGNLINYGDFFIAANKGTLNLLGSIQNLGSFNIITPFSILGSSSSFINEGTIIIGARDINFNTNFQNNRNLNIQPYTMLTVSGTSIITSNVTNQGFLRFTRGNHSISGLVSSSGRIDLSETNLTLEQSGKIFQHSLSIYIQQRSNFILRGKLSLFSAGLSLIDNSKMKLFPESLFQFVGERNLNVAVDLSSSLEINGPIICGNNVSRSCYIQNQGIILFEKYIEGFSMNNSGEIHISTQVQFNFLKLDPKSSLYIHLETIYDTEIYKTIPLINVTEIKVSLQIFPFIQYLKIFKKIKVKWNVLYSGSALWVKSSKGNHFN